MVSYLQLAHNERHPVTGSPVAKVIHNFGRADQVDRAALARLVASISRFLDPAQAVAAAAVTACPGSRNREIEATSRRSASRSTRSARPKLWITFATGLPVTGCRSLCASCRYDTTVPSLFRRRDSRRYTPASQAIQAAQHQRHA